MKLNYEVVEVNKGNKEKYLAGVVELENVVLEKMEREGRIGQLFITGKETIQEYIESPSNHVMVAVTNEEKGDIISAAYITQGQIDFTYNDITKYFKCGKDYQDYIKSKYSDKEYERAVRDVYIKKICAYKYARNVILSEQGINNLQDISEEKKNSIFLQLIESEYNNPENGFHEKSEIRDHLNQYMSLYMKKVKEDMQRYQDFYWIDLDYLKNSIGDNSNKSEIKTGNYDSTLSAYDTILQYQKYKIYDTTHCKDVSKYYNANTSNTIEIDTYITHPASREKGIARILVFEGLKKSLQNVVQKEDNTDIYLVSTLHEDNLSSKYVSEFFGLKDYLFVNRRNGRDREVHIYGMKKEDVPTYIKQMEKKIAVLYNYNPNKLEISDEERIGIIQEQIKYEVTELRRLNSIKEERKVAGYIKCKESKIQELQKLADRIQAKQEKKHFTLNSQNGFVGMETFGLPSDFELE